MKAFTKIALAGAVVAVSGLAPAAAFGQSREPQVRAFEISRGSRIGLSVQDAKERGVIVETVEADGPAGKAGIKAGDTIVEFDGEPVRSVRQFSRLVQETPGGRAVGVAILRNGQRSTVTVTAEERSWNDDFSVRLLDLARPLAPLAPATPRPPRPPVEPFSYAFGRTLGVTIETLDDQLAQYFGVKDGVLVKSVSDDSAAAKAGLKAGDVITSINDRKVYETSDVTRAIERMDNSDEFTIEVMRDRTAQTLKGKLEPRGRRSRMFE
jgi:serine protease Do